MTSGGGAFSWNSELPSGRNPFWIRDEALSGIGLHAGEVIKEGEDFFGRNVIMAARVASQANGGEILTSAVVKALLSGSDVSWGDSRTVTLKGLSGEHEIWTVEWTLDSSISQGP